MALFKEVKCGRCDKRYSAIRSRCPHCGARKNRDGKSAAAAGNSRWQLIVGLVVLLAIVVAVVILLTTSLRNRGPEPVNPTPPADPGVTSVPGTSATPEPTPTPTPTPTPEPTPTPTPAPVVNSIVLSREDFTLSVIDEQYTIAATLSPAGTKAELIWISEDPDVATVDEKGTVTAVDRGTTVVTATAGGVTAECIVRVSADAPDKPATSDTPDAPASSGSLRLSHTDVTIHSANAETFTLAVKGMADGSTVTYSSSKAACASVDGSGHVRAAGNGDATITVTVTAPDGTVTKLECIVRVVT